MKISSDASAQSAALQRFGRLLRWRSGLLNCAGRRAAKETRRKYHERVGE